MDKYSFFRKPRVLVPALLVASLLMWGGRHAYCHFYGHMSGSPSESLAAEGHLPVVTVVEPIRKTATRSITLAASVEAFERATLYAKVSGYLKSIGVDKGDLVRRGEVLAVLEVPEMDKEYQSSQAALQEAEAAYQRAEAEAGLKELTFKRLAGVRESQPNAIAQQEVDVARSAYEVAQADARLAKARIERARSELERIKALKEYADIRSPYDGVVTERFVDPGALIQKGTNSTGNVSPLVTVANVDQVRIYVSVAEPDVPYLKRGNPAQVRLDAFLGRVFEGRVTRFATALDPQTRTMKTEIDLPNPGHLIRPGMYGAATLQLGAEASAVFLPAQSIRQDAAGDKFIFIVEQGRLRKVPVATGLDDGKLIQVIGLRGDETVVLTAPGNLQEGLAVQTVKGSV